MASKLVTDRERSSRVILSILSTHAAAAEEGVRRALPDAHRTLALVPLLLALVAWLEAVLAALIRADQAHEAELADDAAPRARRDRAWSTLRSSVIAFRSVVAANHGDVALKQLGLWDPCPNDFAGTATYARDLVRALDPTPSLPPPRHAAVAADLPQARIELAALHAALETELSGLAASEGRAARTLGDKNRAIDEHHRVRRIVIDVAAGLFEGAGLPELGEELRDAVRRDATNEPPKEAPIAPLPSNGETPAPSAGPRVA